MNIVDTMWVKQNILEEIAWREEEINRDFKEEYMKNYAKSLQEEVDYLKKLNESDLEDIALKVNNDMELEDKINELISYYLFH